MQQQQQLNISTSSNATTASTANIPIYNDYHLNHSTRSNDYYLNEDDEYDLNDTTTYGGGGGGGCKSFDNDDHKAFDENVFDLLKVNSEDIASQLTLIDLPLFKKIQPDELISCKWMSRDKLLKTPNIVLFTKRFNQTTFWTQKEILSCIKLETRAKMLTLFIKIAKRLQEMQNFNSLMAIICALKSAPIYRLKKTWNLIARKDLNYFERICKIMLDTNDNKSKLREMHNNCKLPCIPFLGLYLTDLTYIDIAHPANCFDNPQRRNQMNNICRIISEYQQSQYDKLIEINYVINYLNSFVYFEEFQKFKEDDYYKESLVLEPDNENQTPNNTSTNNHHVDDLNKITSTPNANLSIGANYTNKTKMLLNDGFNSLSSGSSTNFIKHRKTLSYAFNSSSTNGEHAITNELDLNQKHPLDDSLLNVDDNKKEIIKEEELEKEEKQIDAKDTIDGCKQLKTTNQTSEESSEEDEKNRLKMDIIAKIKNEKLRKSFEIYFLNTLNKEQMLNLMIKSQSNLIIFESAIKRKCIMKNSQKTHFKQWKTYWIQLVGNTLVYYQINKLNTLLNINYKQQQAETIQTAILASSSSNGLNQQQEEVKTHLNYDCFNEIIQLDRKYYHKEVFKSHTISNWMCVALFNLDSQLDKAKSDSISVDIPNSNDVNDYDEDDDDSTHKPVSCLNLHSNHHNSQSTSTTTTNTNNNSNSTCNSINLNTNNNKFDIQLNDLNNGNIYKYRLYNYKLAKEWYLLFKQAINLLDNLRPDNLIKFE